MKPASRTDEATTSRSEQTRQRLLNAACELFGARGFDGTSVRDVEDLSGVNRGLIAYHFGNKEDLWKAVVEFYFSDYLREMEAQREIFAALDEGSRARLLVRNFVQMSARRPHLAKMMVQENLNPTWRQDWIIDRFLRPIQALERELFPRERSSRGAAAARFRYALIGACTMPFLAAPEIERIHGLDVFEDKFIEGLTELVTRSFLG